MANNPLFGLRVLVTRPRDQARPLAEALATAGAVPITYPTIALGPPPTWDPFDKAVAMIGSYAWIVFTSPSAVRFTFGRSAGLATQLGLPRAATVAAVGTETAKALAGFGVPVALVPDEQTQEGLVAAFGTMPKGTRVLFPQTIGGRELLREVLSRDGMIVDVVPVSETSALALDLPPPPFDVATFASPSAVRSFAKSLGAAALTGKVVAVIGPTTLQAARAAGVTVHVVAHTPSVAALVTAISDYVGPR